MNANDQHAPFVAYAEEYNNWPSAREGMRRYSRGYVHGQQMGRANPDAQRMTAADVVTWAKFYRRSPDYAEGVYAGIRSTVPRDGASHSRPGAGNTE